MKVDGSSYDIIVIDEVEQVLAHFLSETMADAALEIFSAFKRLIAAASKVVVMDADLGWTSFLTLTTMRSSSKEVEVNAQFILNTWRHKGTSIDLYGSKEHLVGALLNRLENGKRVFVASNSKAEVDRLVTHWLEIQFKVPLVGDLLVYKDPKQKALGYSLKDGVTALMVEQVSRPYRKKKPIETMA